MAAETGRGGRRDGTGGPGRVPERLGKKVSDFKTLKTDFIQEKEMAMFKEKLVMKGRIYLQKPNKVAWHVDSPVRYSVLITDKLIRQWDEDTNKVQEISLAKNPMFQNVLNQLTVWFSGEYGSLLGSQRRPAGAARSRWCSSSRPAEKNMSRKVIKSITITFRDDQKYLQADPDPGSERRRHDHQLHEHPAECASRQHEL